MSKRCRMSGRVFNSWDVKTPNTGEPTWSDVGVSVSADGLDRDTRFVCKECGRTIKAGPCNDSWRVPTHNVEDPRASKSKRITVKSLNAELAGTGFHVARCAQDYGYRYFLFCDVPRFQPHEIIYDISIKSARGEPVPLHKPIGWPTLREARDEMLGIVRVARRWRIIKSARF
jgi:hypothetical protein